ncbi:uncharacterized protein LOC111805006 [Cucurbita pepo subsp. pepo]|uniref:uncharacterized protein LOC111805006 n=1 Tax=Cucurbita pepo subsp. pepo TaxID=3664 RepID=UPI000C9D5D06|nr:uncharacterized protein LOC111805006 [Cucurbita pepo subsp. pepo]
MLLRSASTSILNPWKPHLKEASMEAEIAHQIPKSRPLTLCASSKLLPPPPMIGGPAINMMRTLSVPDLSNLSAVAKRSPFLNGGLFCGVAEVGESSDCGGGMVGVSVDGGIGRDGCGGDGGGSDGGDDGCFGSWDADRENDWADLYYQKMIEANPENSLLLSNYARFLMEVRGDLLKAEEYCGRSISANPNDGNVISMYADLIWKNHKDASRAESYHLQAAKTSPDDSFVLASYARFLWDAGEEVEDDDDDDDKEDGFDSFGEPYSSRPFDFGVQPLNSLL